MSNLYTASNQWMTRPADERFWGIRDLAAFLKRERQHSHERTVPLEDVIPAVHRGSVCLKGKKSDTPALLTHWSFNQLCTYSGAPADYLRTLPAELTVQNITHGLRNRNVDKVQLLLHQSAVLTTRAVTSGDYSRLWDDDLVTAMMPAVDMGWRTPPARPSPVAENDPRRRKATAEDIIPGQGNFGLSVKVGDDIAPAGVYRSDRDLFVFLIHPERIIDDGGKGLMRGVFITNSEVRASSFRAVSFMLENVCGNHIVWNASGVQEFRFYHRGNIQDRFKIALDTNLRDYANEGTQHEEAMIAKARRYQIASTVKGLVEKLHNNKKLQLTLEQINSSVELAKQYESDAHAPPTSAWGFVHGLTRLSQRTPYTNVRSKLDSVGGKILALAV